MEPGAGLQIVVRHQTLSADSTAARRVMELVLEHEHAALEELTLVFADHATVRTLNHEYLAHDYDTDVLAFDYGERPGAVDGEIYVDLDTAAERHEEFGASFEAEYLRYAVHGLLHLIGYRDTTNAGKREMHALEARYLTEGGFMS